jgi:trehalose 6-phosphate phosphatase
MKSVFEYWPEIALRIREQKAVFLALDYDGVLSPIAARPDLAMLPPVNRDLLEKLVKCRQMRVAIISGRSTSDVRRHIEVEGIIYAGNHGAEIDLNGLHESHAGAEDYRAELIEMRTQLNEVFGGFQGVLLEDKGSGIGLHYREVDPADLPSFRERFGN